MTQEPSKFGVYLNPKARKVVRITSPYWIPEPPAWVFVTPEVNASLVKIRQLIAERKLCDDPQGVQWGQIPLRE